MMNYIVAILITLGLGGTLGAIKVTQFKTMMAVGAAMVLPPETISTAVVRKEVWPTTFTAIGSLRAAQGVMVTADIPGIIRVIDFESGANVRQGDLLVELDISAEKAQLEALLAQVDLAQLTVDRNQKLRAENMVSQAEMDTFEAALKQSKASAEAIRATIEKKRIRAPFAGRLGIRQVNLGQYVDSGTRIVSLQALASVYADFTLPQQELGKLATGMAVRLKSDTYPERVFEGKLTAINPDLNATTRSVQLQATFDNPDEALRPGMFARVEVVRPEQQAVLVIPVTAVLSAPYGETVYVVEPAPATNNTPGGLVVRSQLIKTGRVRENNVAVHSGLKEGDQVADSGLLKLRPGAAVRVNNEIKPPAGAAQRLSDS